MFVKFLHTEMRETKLPIHSSWSLEIIIEIRLSILGGSRGKLFNRPGATVNIPAVLLDFPPPSFGFIFSVESTPRSREVD